MKKLISMTDFVLEQDVEFKPTRTYKELVINYAKFLKQPLELWMFVPCGEDGNVLTKSTMSENTCEDDCNHKNCVLEMNECIKYQQAKERCLFEGCNIFDGWCLQFADATLFEDIKKLKHFTIEDLIPYGLILTKTAQKQIN